MLAFVVVPISVLTLGLGAIVLDASLVGLVLDRLPGVTLSGFWTSLCVVIGLAAVSSRCVGAGASTTPPGSTGAWPGSPAGRASAAATDVAGIVFVQVDGLAEAVLRRALRSGDVPTMDRWLRDGSPADRLGDRLVVADRGQPVRHPPRLDGDAGVPLGRQGDRRRIVSNRPESAAAIERPHSDGRGLLAHHGSSYGNLFSGDAERAVLTMSGIARRKEGRFGAGYFGYFSRPQQATRTLLVLVDDGPRAGRRPAAAPPGRRAAGAPADVRAPAGVHNRREPRRVGAGRADRHGRGPRRGLRRPARLRRGRTPLRPERADTLAVLRDMDRQVGRIARAALGAAALPHRRAVRPRPDAGRAVPRTGRRDAGRARRPAVRRGELGGPRRREGPHRVDRLAAAGRTTRRAEEAAARAAPDSRPCSGRAASG